MLEPTLLDELICHIASLASVYHKPPTAFVEGTGGLKRVLPSREEQAKGAAGQAAQVIPEPGSLIGDLLSMDLGAPSVAAGASGGGVDLLGGGLGDLIAGPSAQAQQPSTNNLLGEIFGLGGTGGGLGMSTTTFYIPPKQE